MGKQQQMPGIIFKIMTTIMSFGKLFRNIDAEVKYAGIKSEDYILDFGCGPGFNTIPAAKIIGQKAKVYALDINKQAINIVNIKARKYKLNNIETIISNCNSDLKNNTIDIVYLHNTLPMIKNKKDVLNEIHRVLKLNGRLSYMSRIISRFTDNNSMSDEQLKEYLESENKFKLIKNKKKHFIFEKIN